MDIVEALEMFEEALGIYSCTVGVDHPNVADLHFGRGYCKEGFRDKEGALESYREVQRIYGMHGISSDDAEAVDECVSRLEGSL